LAAIYSIVGSGFVPAYQNYYSEIDLDAYGAHDPADKLQQIFTNVQNLLSPAGRQSSTNLG
jgi:hypothetical protein